MGLNILQKNIDYLELFFSDRAHNWIRKDKDIYRAFVLLFECLPRNVKRSLLKKKKLTFIRSEQNFATTIEAPSDRSLVIVYEELIKLFKGPLFPQGVAVLAHEIGHIINNHSKRKISMLEAQFEADKFVIDIGLEEELIDFLTDHCLKGDCKIRLDKIISNK